MNETATGPVLLGVGAFGLALAYLWAERHATSRLLSATLALLGTSVLLNAGSRLQWPLFGQAWRLAGIAEGLTLAVFLHWLGILVHRSPALRTAARWLRAGQWASLAYVVLAVVAPVLRNGEFAGRLIGQLRPGALLFGVPLAFAGATAILAIVHLLRGGLDRAERSQLLGFMGAAPLWLAAVVVPAPGADLLVGLGLVLFVAGSLRYHALRGHEAQFLTRFLSPQVLRMIQQRGLRQGLRGDAIELTAVCCDLRGFTRYTQAHPTEYSLQLLREYYGVVGRVTTAYGGTLKDFVGDGALILIGAPLRVEGHARVGLALADQLRREVERMLRRWSPRLHRLDVGIGVASGMVQVGIIASDSRYEYVAVGPAVNLASRLCEVAGPGQVLVAPDTAALAPDWQTRLRHGPRQSVKGVEAPVETRLLPPQDPAGPAGQHWQVAPLAATG